MLVHRLLAASLGLAPLPESARDRAGVHALTDNLNSRHRNAQMAGRASVELHTLIFFKDRTIIADARITRVSYLSMSNEQMKSSLIFFSALFSIFTNAALQHVRHASLMFFTTELVFCY